MMRIERRSLLGAAAASLAPLRGHAADFPGQDIKFIIPYGAGGGFDLYVRQIAPAMAAALPNKVQILPENIDVGGGVKGISQLYKSKSDGATIGVLNIPGMFVLQRGGGALFDLAKFSYIGSMGRDYYGIGVAQNSPIKSMADLRTLSEQRPIKFPTTGREGTAFSATVIAMKLLGLRGSFITGYKGSNDYIVAAIRGDGDAVITTLPLMRQMRDGGLMRILATFEDKSSVPGAEDSTSLGQPGLSEIILERVVAAPPKLPAPIQATLSRALGEAIADPAVKAWADKTGTLLVARSPDDTAKLIADQAKFYETWKIQLDAA